MLTCLQMLGFESENAMDKDLTNSDVHRNNILNNRFALEELEKEVAYPGISFEGEFRYTKKQMALFFDIDERTVERYIEQHSDELRRNGYELLSGGRLKEFKEEYLKSCIESVSGNWICEMDVNDDGTDINVATKINHIQKTSILGVFTFRAFLNLGMLLTESTRAKQLRSLILDIVIDTINLKIGGNTKYINQREQEYLPSAIREFSFRKTFTDTLDSCLVENKWKYAQFTDSIYRAIFHENAKEYKQILNLNSKEAVRGTMYSEVLDLIAAYENGFAAILQRRRVELDRKLTMHEANQLFREFEQLHAAAFLPLLEKARTLMSSRDMVFRDALHEKLKDYVTHLNAEEFEKFLGEKSVSLEERLKDNLEVFKRLKNR